MRKGLSQENLDAASLLKQLEVIEQSATGMDRMVSALLDVERMAEDKLILVFPAADAGPPRARPGPFHCEMDCGGPSRTHLGDIRAWKGERI